MAVGALFSLAMGANGVFADESATYLPIVSRIAEKFNLNEADVQAVFNAVRDEHQEQMRSMREKRLNQAVTDGVITEDQKNALLQKEQEMWQQRQQYREEMLTWFEQQGIDSTKFAPYMGFGHRGGMHWIK